MADFHELIEHYGAHAFAMAAVISILFWIIFIWRYVSSQTERSGWTKFLDLFFMFFYMALFILYMGAGAYLSTNMTGSAAPGVAGGIFVFWLMFEIMAYIKKKRTKV